MLNNLFARLRGPGCMFLYWVVFLLALEPANILRARDMGRTLEFDIEALRIGVAALLACSSAPLLIWLARRFPLSSVPRARCLTVHAAGVAGISLVLIVISCFLAAWILMAKPLPAVAELRGQLAANWLLLTFALALFSVLSHVLAVFPRHGLNRLPIKTRGRLGHIDLSTVEWIESQGNYLALHVGGRSHLIRETLKSFARRIDATRFVRVHRRMLVDVYRIREVQPLANGDSLLKLQGGRQIRASRSYRAAVRTRWAEVMARR